MKTLDADTPDREIRSQKDLTALLSETINQVRKGIIDPRIANSVAFLSSHLAKALVEYELEDRIDKLEQIIKDRTKIPDVTLTRKQQ